MKLLVYIMGKSATGKDTIFNELLKNKELKRLVIYTTRPMRIGEIDGYTYFFKSVEEMKEMEEFIVEKRVYHTVLGDWYYYTAEDGQFDSADILVGIGTLESYIKLKQRLGEEIMMPVYIEVEDSERLRRAIERENSAENPNIAEVYRRFEADNIDFSDKNLSDAGIIKRYVNNNFTECVENIQKDIWCRIDRI